MCFSHVQVGFDTFADLASEFRSDDESSRNGAPDVVPALEGFKSALPRHHEQQQQQQPQLHQLSGDETPRALVAAGSAADAIRLKAKTLQHRQAN